MYREKKIPTKINELNTKEDKHHTWKRNLNEKLEEEEVVKKRKWTQLINNGNEL